MVSVIIPVYNVEKYIKRCLESVLNQTYKDIEIVIVDDGSADSTRDICEEYAKDNCFVTYIRKENEGQGVARTLGLQSAKGKYVTFLDGDDWLEADAIESMMIAAETYKADVVVGDCYYVYNGTDGLDKRYSKVRYEDSTVLCKGEHLEKINRLRTFTCAKLYSREYLVKQGFTQPSYAYEDIATIPLLMAQAERIVYINKPVYNYLKDRSDSTIHNGHKQKDMYIALKDMYSGFKRLKNFDEYKVELKRMVWSQIRFMCIMSGVTYEQIISETDGKYEELKKLAGLINELFPDFVCPDQCSIEIINNIYAKRAVGNVLISMNNIKCTVDDEDSSERIIVSYGDESKKYMCTDGN
ncbi:MAG: glycosyltransferase family 2 protein, partial [Lachnospiraceae bacterium]|nr:glycosyltransferase family 2 protein [Lachnospiraceae bacterium]